MKVVLPDSTELELPDGSSGLDAARAIGPKLAEQAVLLRANGSVRDLRLPLQDGERIQILTTRDTDDADALAVLRRQDGRYLASTQPQLPPGVDPTDFDEAPDPAVVRILGPAPRRAALLLVVVGGLLLVALLVAALVVHRRWRDAVSG